jgi:hypothetical protein
MKTASDIRKAYKETVLVQQARCAIGASKIAGRNFDLVRWAESRVVKWIDPASRARALARIAVEASQGTLDEQAMQLLLSAVMNARLAGRAAVLDVLATGAEVIAKIDRGETLLRLYQEFLAVDHWMTDASDE